MWGKFKIILLVVAGILAIPAIRSFVYQPFSMPSGSMIPSVLIGDYFFVAKYSYGYSKYSVPCDLFDLCDKLPSGRIFGSVPKRGDVAVFKVPTDNRTDFIKRVIGLPGDEIQMRRGELYINGQQVPRELISDRNESAGAGYAQRVRIYKETLPGGSQHLIQTLGDQSGPANNTAVYKVPLDQFFMMGDSRDNSEDSRMAFGGSDEMDYVPFENLVGRATVIFYSANVREPGEQPEPGAPSPRPGRILKPIE